MQQNDETRFEDFVGLISGLYKEIQRIKTSEGARLGLKGSDVMCLYYLERSKDGLTGADLASALGWCVLPYLPGDAVKIALAAALTIQLDKRLKGSLV